MLVGTIRRAADLLPPVSTLSNAGCGEIRPQPTTPIMHSESSQRGS